MRNITAVFVALSFLAATSLPTIAATAANTDELSAASHVKMKKPTKAACKKDPKLEGCDKMAKPAAKKPADKK